ncbi:MAG TPA: heme exporter protein CcmD [Nevskiaceae bacterium]|nr:heme exporter protein CcmD [Nevskiaceae bacterium]
MSSEALHQFLQMGGYAPFVWGSFGCAALVLVWNVLAPRWQRRALRQQLEMMDPDD